MHENGSNSLANIVCHCSGTSIENIKSLISEGYETVEKISQMTGACSGCGACEDKVSALLTAAVLP